MTSDQYIALFASLGACLSALATLWTVREMAKQRKAIFKPELAVARRRFVTRPSFTSKQADWFVNAGPSANEQSLEKATLNLANVGLGAAKDVQIMWSFYVADVVARFNNLAK